VEKVNRKEILTNVLFHGNDVPYRNKKLKNEMGINNFQRKHLLAANLGFIHIIQNSVKQQADKLKRYCTTLHAFSSIWYILTV